MLSDDIYEWMNAFRKYTWKEDMKFASVSKILQKNRELLFAISPTLFNTFTIITITASHAKKTREKGIINYT